MAGKAKV